MYICLHFQKNVVYIGSTDTGNQKLSHMSSTLLSNSEDVNPLDLSLQSVIGSSNELSDCRKSTDFDISTYRQKSQGIIKPGDSFLIKNVFAPV